MTKAEYDLGKLSAYSVVHSNFILTGNQRYFAVSESLLLRVKMYNSFLRNTSLMADFLMNLSRKTGQQKTLTADFPTLGCYHCHNLTR
ncbi:hypothetical protein BaRGS_00033275 [Batillaria attramentaria]|uniref:Uncharacterized protein n=1 Tax=Batillaria attramentaria TaxID=370345 RepID=A0ABD0JLA4_9CAEN